MSNRRIIIVEIDSASVGLYMDKFTDKMKELKEENKHLIKSIRVSQWTKWRINEI